MRNINKKYFKILLFTCLASVSISVDGPWVQAQQHQDPQDPPQQQPQEQWPPQEIPRRPPPPPPSFEQNPQRPPLQPALPAVQIPWQPEWRVGYAAAGRAYCGPCGQTILDYQQGAVLGARVLFDGTQIAANWRIHFAAGADGVNYAALNLRTVRLRMPLDGNRVFWVAAAPADVEAQVACVGSECAQSRLRNRIGWQPNIMAGIMKRFGNGCLLQLFAKAGASIGVQQTQDSDAVHGLTGAEALTYCRNITVDLSYLHFFSMHGADVNRVDGDVALHGRVGPLDVGPFLSTQVSQEYGSSSSSLGDRTRYDQVYFQALGGLRVSW